MIKRDKVTGKLCRVYQVASGALFSDLRLVLLGTETEVPKGIKKDKEYTLVARNLSQLEIAEVTLGKMKGGDAKKK